MVNLEDLDRKLDRILFGQAELSLRLKRLSPEELATAGEIRQEQENMYQRYLNRRDGQPVERARIRRL